MPPSKKQFSPLDQALIQLDTLLRRFAIQPTASRPTPAKKLPNPELSTEERKHAAGLMRVNHVGEVCAQALYLGQAAVAKDANIKRHLIEAAKEEADHLVWCKERLKEFEDRTSYLNPLWFAGAYTLGAVAGFAGDSWNLGFVVETERQVEAHLDGHLTALPAQDTKSRAIVQQMKQDEMAHANAALALGAKELPALFKVAMKASAKVMTTIAYRI